MSAGRPIANRMPIIRPHSEHRRRNDREVHADALPPPPLLDHGLVPGGEPDLVTDQSTLHRWVDTLRAAGTFAFDTEFIGERTFHAKTCLVQVSTPDRIALLDPLAGLDLDPFWRLLADAEVAKLVHAGRQDFEPVARLLRAAPANVFDTQVAAGLVGLGYPRGLTGLVEELGGADPGQGAKFSQWDRRPLTPVQLRYAADDVRYLHLLKAKLDEMLRECGRAAWADEEMRRFEEVELYRFDPLAQRLKASGNGKLSRRQQAVRDAVMIWRGTTAEAEDIPPRTLLPDPVVLALAEQQPGDEQALRQVKGTPRAVRDRYAEQIVAAVEKGQSAELPPRWKPPRRPAKFKSAFRAFWGQLNERCEQAGVDAGLAVAKQQAEQWFRGVWDGKPVGNSRLDAGWRRELFGDLLDAAGSLVPERVQQRPA